MASIKCPFCEIEAVPFSGTNYVKCDGCGLFTHKDIPSKEQIKEMNKNFLLGTCNHVKPGASRIKNANEQQLDLLEKYMSPGVVYDVGAASGFFMKAAMDRGWIAYGNEISTKAIKWAKDYYDIDVEYGFVEESSAVDKHFDVVVMWNTLEHTYNAKETLDKCVEMLKDGGYVFIRVPNKKTVSDLTRFYERVHFFEFTDECLTRHLENLGFNKTELILYNPPGKVPYADYLYRRQT